MPAQAKVCGYPNQTKTFDTHLAPERWAKATEVEMAQSLFRLQTIAQNLLRNLLDRYYTDARPLKKWGQARNNED